MNNTNSQKQFVDYVLGELEIRRQHEPYQINLLEEVHMHDKGEGIELTGTRRKVCENAHTRILRKILGFKNEEGYIILKSLIRTVEQFSCKNWGGIDVESPIFIPEANCNYSSGRIDLLIKEDGKYAVIVENKINDAGDQDNQIARYIRHIHEEGFPYEQIYVLYLSSEGSAPNENSWLYDGIDYAPMYIGGTYFNFSYKEYILPWLKNQVLPLVEQMHNQHYLISAVEQYIDYLERRFSLKKDELAQLHFILNENLFPDKATQLSINDKVAKIDSRIKELESLIIQVTEEGNDTDINNTKRVLDALTSLKRKLIQELVGNYDYADVLERNNVYERTNHYGVIIGLNNRQYVLYIGEFDKKFFCSIISYPTKNEAIDPSSQTKFSSFFKSKAKRYGDWMATYFEKGDYESAIMKMKEVLEGLLVKMY